jgi:hypothetical protein
MDLVHCDMNVKVVRVVVNDAHALTLGETKHSTELLLAIEQDICAWAFPLAKREKQMVRLVVIRPAGSVAEWLRLRAQQSWRHPSDSW